MWILTLKMANTNRGVESEVEIVAYVGGQSLDPHMSVVPLVFHPWIWLGCRLFSY